MKLRILLAAAALLFAAGAAAFTPRTGHWYDPAEDGTGYNIDIQDGKIVVTVYSYKTDGDSEWYIATGDMTNGQQSFTGTLTKLRNGACISCAYVKPILAGSDGTISISFTSETTATVTKPGGRVAEIKPLNFGFGDPPTGLLGEWVFVEDINGSFFVDHYNFTVVGGATATGSGIVMDTARNAVCEYKVSGQFVGSVVCFRWSDSSLTTIVDQYLYKPGLDQTFEGEWISPTTFNSYPMKGNIWVSRSGHSKSLGAAPDPRIESERKRQAELSAAGQRTKARSKAIDVTAVEQLKAEMRGALLGAR